MRTQPASFDDRRPGIDGSVKKPSGVTRRIGARLLHEMREAVPPTIFFFVGFNCRSNHHPHGQLDDVFPVVPQPAHIVSRGCDDVAARWFGLPGGAGINAAENPRTPCSTPSSSYSRRNPSW
jgi:hypothetical protein